ncbi:hypothetical protein JCM10212_000200 [Sporobolomyces blumeae]
MARRRRSDSSSSLSHDDSSDESSDDRARRRSRRRASPPKQRPESKARYARGGIDSDTDDSVESVESSSDEDARAERRRLNKRTSSTSTERSLGAAVVPPPPAQTRSTLTCFLGVALALALVVVGGYALWTWGQSSNSSTTTSEGSNGGQTTVTVTKEGPGSGGGASTSPSATATGTIVSIETSSESNSTATSSSSSNSSSSSSSSITLSGISRNNIGIGFLPDYTNQKMSDIRDGLGIKSSFYGWYAQLPASGDWDGSQLLSQMDDVKACNCIFQPAVMPTKGWKGLTSSDNSQALAIAKVMKQFTDEGIDVHLRFAHEVNWYQTDGTYQGTADDFKEGWKTVAAAVADNPKVKMFFTPNIAGSIDDYDKYMPEDLSTVHLLGIDWYPTDATQRFVDHMAPLYDKYCKDGKILFAIGETGNGWEAPIEDRLKWLDELTSEETAKAMPYYVGITWFNYDKEREFRLWIKDDDSTDSATKDWLGSNDVVASGATAGNA